MSLVDAFNQELEKNKSWKDDFNKAPNKQEWAKGKMALMQSTALETTGAGWTGTDQELRELQDYMKALTPAEDTPNKRRRAGVPLTGPLTGMEAAKLRAEDKKRLREKAASATEDPATSTWNIFTQDLFGSSAAFQKDSGFLLFR